MRPRAFAAIFLLAILTLSALCLSLRADDCPHYLILEPLPQGRANPVQAHAYAYGWFGAGRYSASTWHRTWSNTGYRWTYTPGY